jgi:hypothetical protein
MSDNQTATAHIQNKTAFNLVYVNSGLSWGKWIKEAVKKIPPHATDDAAFIAQGRTASPSGTEGFVVYALMEAASDISKPTKPFATITLNFDDPWAGQNKISATSDNPKVNVNSYVPPHGSAVPFTYEVNALLP